MRCQKSKRVCPGYRDAFELKLRNETKSTKKKISRRQPQQDISSNKLHHVQFANSSTFHPQAAPFVSGGSLSLSSSHSSKISIVGMRDTQQNLASPLHHHHLHLTSSPTTSIIHQAACFFLSNHVLVPEKGTMRGYLDYVVPLWKQEESALTCILGKYLTF